MLCNNINGEIFHIFYSFHSFGFILFVSIHAMAEVVSAFCNILVLSMEYLSSNIHAFHLAHFKLFCSFRLKLLLTLITFFCQKHKINLFIIAFNVLYFISISFSIQMNLWLYCCCVRINMHYSERNFYVIFIFNAYADYINNIYSCFYQFIRHAVRIHRVNAFRI